MNRPPPREVSGEQGRTTRRRRRPGASPPGWISERRSRSFARRTDLHPDSRPWHVPVPLTWEMAPETGRCVTGRLESWDLLLWADCPVTSTLSGDTSCLGEKSRSDRCRGREGEMRKQDPGRGLCDSCARHVERGRRSQSGVRRCHLLHGVHDTDNEQNVALGNGGAAGATQGGRAFRRSGPDGCGHRGYGDHRCRGVSGRCAHGSPQSSSAPDRSESPIEPHPLGERSYARCQLD